jgi:Domain of unknown function (DUF3859)
MKTLYVLLAFIVPCCCLAESPVVEGKVTSFGLFKFPSKPQIVSTPETPGGATGRLTDAPILITATNRVPAKIGVRFGITFEITRLPVPDGVVGLTKIVRHPLITAPDGATSSRYKTIQRFDVRGGKVVGWTGYGFDLNYELVGGDWECELQFGGKSLCSQKFIVMKE